MTFPGHLLRPSAARGGAEALDPLQTQVEDAIRRVVGDLLALPCQVVRSVAGWTARPWVLTRSLVSMTADGLARRAAPAGGRPPAAGAPARPAGRRPGRPAPARPAPPPAGAERGLHASDLPIADYESLAASQVVARLDRLAAADLRRVAAFEAAHRGRRTVLGKIEHLLASSSR